jgi:thioredoxin-related protein/YHS domain-containing protein
MRRYADVRTSSTVLLAAIGFFTLAVIPASGRAADEPLWQTDLDAAMKLSQKHDRPLLLHFFATWCGPCQRMERETFTASDFGKQVGGRFVMVWINSDRHPDLVRQYGVTGLPSDVFVSSNGRILSRNAGYLSKRQYFAQLARWESRFVKRSKVQIAAAKPKPVQPQPAKPQAGAGTQIAEATKPAAPEKVLIGMDGYSPVAMHRDRKWVAGKKEYSWPHHGVSYWMANAEELAVFRRDPGRFAPKLLGCDPVILNETDRALPGKVHYGAIFDGELFFFTSADSRAKFRKNPLTYTRTRHVLRVNDINGIVRR